MRVASASRQSWISKYHFHESLLQDATDAKNMSVEHSFLSSKGCSTRLQHITSILNTQCTVCSLEWSIKVKFFIHPYFSRLQKVQSVKGSNHKSHYFSGLTEVTNLKHVFPLGLKSLQNLSFHSYPASTDKMQSNLVLFKRYISCYLSLSLKGWGFSQYTLISKSAKFITDWNFTDHQANSAITRSF